MTPNDEGVLGGWGRGGYQEIVGSRKRYRVLDRAALALRNIRERVTFVGLTDDYDVSMLLFREWLNDAHFEPSCAVRNKARHAPAWSIFDQPELHRIVEDANAQDIRLYQDVCRQIYPAQQARYEGDMERDLARLISPRQQADKKEYLWPKFKRTFLYKPLLHLR